MEVEAIRKAIHCRTGENGFRTYFCMGCNKIHRVYFSCKSRLCGPCGARANEIFAEQFVRRMLPVTHRHITFTIPDMLWKKFHSSVPLLHGLAKAVNDTIRQAMEMYLGLEVVPGILTVIHVFGRDLKENCHIHSIVTEGGTDKAGIWHPFTYFPFEKRGRVHITLNELWMENVLKLLKKHLPKMKETDILIEFIRSNYTGGFYVNGPSQNRIKTSRSLKNRAKYIMRYVKHPAISDNRIVRFDGKEVEFWYQQPSTRVRITVVMPVMDFLRAVLKHVPEKHFRAVMYYGLYSPNYPQMVKFQTVFSIDGDFVDPLYLSWREETYLRTGRDPKRCKTCGRDMVLISAIYLKNGDYVYCSYLPVEDRIAIGYHEDELELFIRDGRFAR